MGLLLTEEPFKYLLKPCSNRYLSLACRFSQYCLVITLSIKSLDVFMWLHFSSRKMWKGISIFIWLCTFFPLRNFQYSVFYCSKKSHWKCERAKLTWHIPSDFSSDQILRWIDRMLSLWMGVMQTFQFKVEFERLSKWLHFRGRAQSSWHGNWPADVCWLGIRSLEVHVVWRSHSSISFRAYKQPGDWCPPGAKIHIH